jgi:hypothetical protein
MFGVRTHWGGGCTVIHSNMLYQKLKYVDSKLLQVAHAFTIIDSLNIIHHPGFFFFFVTML